VAVTLTSAVVDAGAAGVHVQLVADPLNAVHPGMAANVVPPFRDSDTLNEEGNPEAVQRIVDGTFTNTFSPPFGDVICTVSGGRTSIVTLAVTVA
jgi:hypothetical protein